MKPIYPLTHAFEDLPGQLPIYEMDNALLPGGEFPLELKEASDLALFIEALRTDQMIGLVQPKKDAGSGSRSGQHYLTGCAGRLRQYRERKDGRINVMLTGVCRFTITEESRHEKGYTLAKVDWSNFANDYDTEVVDPILYDDFKANLRSYFKRHNMGVDWKVLEEQAIEKVTNNLVLVVNLDTGSKQKLLEAPTVSQRIALFSQLLQEKDNPILAPEPERRVVN
jgi:Lon protease-like protein